MLPRFAIGDTLSLTRSLPQYPATAGWVLKLRIAQRVYSSMAPVEITGTASGTDHTVAATAAATAAWVTGTCTWVLWITDGTASHTLETGTTELLPNPRTATAGLDLRSETQVALDNVRATMRGRASADVLRYTINGRELQHYSVADLIALEFRLSAQVNREVRTAALAAGLADPRRYTVRLGRA
jgi:hypothetical protein